MNTTNRSRPGAVILPRRLIRTELQQDRDRTAGRIKKSWPTRRHQVSRGIQNPNNWCFINSALQTLLHLPKLLNILRNHNHTTLSAVEADDENPACAACIMRDLSNAYWGDTPVSRPIPNPGPDLTRIGHLAVNNRCTARIFGEHLEMSDADEMYLQLIDHMRESSRTKAWSKQMESLFLFDTVQYAQCQVCGSRRTTLRESATEMGIHPNVAFDNAILDYFRDTIDMHCQTCGVQNQPHDTHREIIAGPHYLRLRICIFGHAFRTVNGVSVFTPWKNAHSMPFDEVLDLTRFQQLSALPLRYKIHSVISHSGTMLVGHYVSSTRGQGTDITCISDTQKEMFTVPRLLQSPQQPTITNPKTVYVLTYVRDDGALTPVQKELKKLL